MHRDSERACLRNAGSFGKTEQLGITFFEQIELNAETTFTRKHCESNGRETVDMVCGQLVKVGQMG